MVSSSLLLALSASIVTVTSQLPGIPTVPYTKADGNAFSLNKLETVVIDSKFAKNQDKTGSTLIPPTLKEFGTTFAQDLKSVLGINVTIVDGSQRQPNSVFLTLDSDGEYRDAAGRKTSEGYTLSADKDGVTISGASPLGAWWGTRTILQQAILGDKTSIAPGKGVDAPGWATRGMMLDVARHYYPKEFLVDLCSYMSFFKQNTFQIHLTDNVIVPTYTPENFNETYARFRLWSDSDSLRGLNKYRNESYTQKDFDEIQSKCASRGVTVIPEIEAPGHALPIVQWKPQIGFAGDLSLLNISHPETIPTMKTIWKEFLPWFHSTSVSIGADEYKGPEDDYKKLVNEMAGFIGQESQKSVRIWGTFPTKKTALSSTEIMSNITIQHWAYLFGNPYEQYIKNNYSVINSDEMFYVVMKDGPYGRAVDPAGTFKFDPATHGSWYPNIFSVNNTADNPARNNSLIMGAVSPLWNDHGANSSTYSEAYYAWRDGIPALADKHWGGSLTSGQFSDIVGKLRKQIPNQNLERVIPSKTDVIFKYDLTSGQSSSIKDGSSNQYDAKSDCQSTGKSLGITPNCKMTMPWDSKGRNYKLTITLKVDKLDDPSKSSIIAGSDSTLMLTPNLTLFASGNYYRLNTTIPLQKWVVLDITSRGPKTFASAKLLDDGKDVFSEQEFLATISYYGQPLRRHEMAIEAPIGQISGWTGELRDVTLTKGAKDGSELGGARQLSKSAMVYGSFLSFWAATLFL